MTHTAGTPFREMMQSLAPGEQGLAIDLPGDWLQGRTAYGGLTGALCVEAAARLHPGLPPLRNAHSPSPGPPPGAWSCRPRWSARASPPSSSRPR